MIKIIGLILLASINYSVFAMDCLSLSDGETIGVKISKSEAFNNCLLLDEVEHNTTLKFTVFALDKVLNKVTLYDVDADGASTYISSYDSNIEAVNGFSLNTTNRTIAFKLSPTSHLTTDKYMTITYLTYNSEAHIMVYLTNILPPPNTGPAEDDCVAAGTCNVNY